MLFGLVPFGRSDPARKLERLPVDKLAEEETRLGIRAESINLELNRLRQQYDHHTRPRRAGETDNDVRLRASKAKRLKPQIDVLQSDFNSLLQQQEFVGALIHRKSSGMQAIKGQERIDDLSGGLSPRELEKALQERQRQAEVARAKTERLRGHASDPAPFAEAPGGMSEEERLINLGAEPAWDEGSPEPARSDSKKPTRRT